MTRTHVQVQFSKRDGFTITSGRGGHRLFGPSWSRPHLLALVHDANMEVDEDAFARAMQNPTVDEPFSFAKLGRNQHDD